MQLSITTTELLNMSKSFLRMPNKISRLEANRDGIDVFIKVPLLGERSARIRFQNYHKSKLFLKLEISGFLISKILPFFNGLINSQLPSQISFSGSDITVELNSLIEEKVSGVQVDKIEYHNEKFIIEANLSAIVV